MENSECKNEFKSIENKNTDSTANAVMLFEMSIKRIDDLRIAEAHRNDDLRIAEVQRIHEQLAIHAIYEEKLTIAEQKRLDAIRSVDTTAVATAADRAAVQAQVLAKNVTESAETLRALVASTATSVASNLAQVSTQLTDRITLLEKKQYENQGKSSVTDPQLDALLKKMDKVFDDRVVAHETTLITANALADHVEKSAETLRTLVASNAESVAKNLEKVSTQLADRIASIEKKQYENQGKSSVTDPQIEALLKKMDAVIESRAVVTGTGMGRKEMYGWILGGIVTLITILGFVIPHFFK